MDYMKPLVVTGTVTRLGSGVGTPRSTQLTVVEITEDNGNVVAIDDVIVSNHMANYMDAGSKVTIHFVRTDYLHRVPGKKWWYVYAIDAPNRRLEEWPYTITRVATVRIMALVFISFYALSFLASGLLVKGSFIGALLPALICAVPAFFIFKSIKRSASLIRAVEIDLGREAAAKKRKRNAYVMGAVGLLFFAVFAVSVLSGSFDKWTGQEEVGCVNDFKFNVETAKFLRTDLMKQIDRNSPTDNNRRPGKCGQYYASALQQLPTWQEQVRKPVGYLLNDRKHSINLGGPVGLKVTELPPEDYGLESGSEVKIPVVQAFQGPGEPKTIAFSTVNDATQYRDALADTIRRYGGRVVSVN